MGILNVTPDSFFDGGIYNHYDHALNHVASMVN
ncbi:MAG: dihydropteroate synthase, partial [Arsenophonus sp. NC-QC1-MAG3]